MRVPVVNSWLIYSALSSLEAAESQFGPLNVDPDDAVQLKGMLARFVAPKVAKWKEPWRDKLRLSLSYYSAKPAVIEGVIASLQDLTMAEPTSYSAFCDTLWEVLFPSENKPGIDRTTIVEHNDISELNEIECET